MKKHFSYNWVSDYYFAKEGEKICFEDWCDFYGITVITSWDAGMYGNIWYKVEKDGVIYRASAYQSLHHNFTFDLNLANVAENDKQFCSRLKGSES